MDNKKDIKDTPMTEKDISQTRTAMSFITSSPELLFVKKRANKLSAGVHLVTTLLSDREPLSQRLKDKSLDVLVHAHTPEITPVRNTGWHTLKLCRDIEEIVGLLSIGHAAGLISGMNYEILAEEYRSLSVFAYEQGETIWGGENGALALSSDFFESPHEDVPGPTRETMSQRVSLAPTSVSMAGSAAGKIPPEELSLPRGSGRAHGRNAPAVMPVLTERNASRRRAIFALFKDKKAITVKDVSRVLRDCSEKTLQRELTALVAEGALRKEGERRWSAYLLA